MLRWCERDQVRYVVGIARNPRVLALSEELRGGAEARFAATGRKQRLFGSMPYAAKTWGRARRVIVKAQHSSFGANPRFVVPNLPYGERYLYERVFRARGDMENRIKNQQADMFEGLRRMALGDTDLAPASPDRIR